MIFLDYIILSKTDNKGISSIRSVFPVCSIHMKISWNGCCFCRLSLRRGGRHMKCCWQCRVFVHFTLSSSSDRRPYCVLTETLFLLPLLPVKSTVLWKPKYVRACVLSGNERQRPQTTWLLLDDSQSFGFTCWLKWTVTFHYGWKHKLEFCNVIMICFQLNSWCQMLQLLSDMIIHILRCFN